MQKGFTEISIAARGVSNEHWHLEAARSRSDGVVSNRYTKESRELKSVCAGRTRD